MKALAISFGISLFCAATVVYGGETMKVTDNIQFIRKDLVFYSYDKKPPLFKRIFGVSVFSPFYDQSGEWLETNERMIGIPVSGETLMDPHASDIVQRLLQKDWSVLESSGRIFDWTLQPLIFLGLARCKNCNGPFSVFGEIHGKASNGTIYLGGIFLMEIEKESALDLIEKAFDNNLIANHEMEEKAIVYAKSLGSQKDFAQLSIYKKEAMAFGRQGMEHWEKGDLDQAIDSFSKALKLFETLDNEQSLAITRQMLGSLYYSQGNIDKAEPLVTQALNYFEVQDMGDDLIVCYGLLGSMAVDQKNFAEAESIFDKALQAAISMDKKDMIARVLVSLGNVYKATDKPQQARDAYQKALELAEETGDRDQANSTRSLIEQIGD